MVDHFESYVVFVAPAKTAEGLRSESDFVSHRAFSYDVTVAMLVCQNNEAAPIVGVPKQ